MNTDGLTVQLPRSKTFDLQFIADWWEMVTGLTLEQVEYSRMFIRDVNNYIAEKQGGGVKRKGAYEYEREWHQNQSAPVIPKAAEAHLVHGTGIREFVMTHDDKYDFMLRAKAPGGHGWCGSSTVRTTHYRARCATTSAPHRGVSW